MALPVAMRRRLSSSGGSASLAAQAVDEGGSFP
jgi:hypothetical protein